MGCAFISSEKDAPKIFQKQHLPPPEHTNMEHRQNIEQSSTVSRSISQVFRQNRQNRENKEYSGKAREGRGSRGVVENRGNRDEKDQKIKLPERPVK